MLWLKPHRKKLDNVSFSRFTDAQLQEAVEEINSISLLGWRMDGFPNYRTFRVSEDADGRYLVSELSMISSAIAIAGVFIGAVMFVISVLGLYLGSSELTVLETIGLCLFSALLIYLWPILIDRISLLGLSGRGRSTVRLLEQVAVKYRGNRT